MLNEFLLPEMETERERVARMPLAERVERAVRLLRDNEPKGQIFATEHGNCAFSDNYYLAFSGGKDSCVIKKLAQLAGVRFEAWYNNTTIDPPELVRFIKREHPDVRWNQPKHGNMLHRIATAPKVPPTRRGRWCCEEYKEGGGDGRVKVFGVRAEESPGRARRWQEVARDQNGDTAICPIVYWTAEQLWEFIHAYEVPYCSLYDEGFDRLGCVGCPLASQASRDREAARWPKYEEKWERAVKASWEKWRNVPNTKTGQPRFQAKYPTADAFWQWWRRGKHGQDVMREDCQSMILWTNEDGS